MTSTVRKLVNFDTTALESFDNITDISSTSDTVICFTKDTVFFAWQNVKQMLEEEADAAARSKLDQKAEVLFNCWLMLGGFLDAGL
jgi:hypothetical protein